MDLAHCATGALRLNRLLAKYTALTQIFEEHLGPLSAKQASSLHSLGALIALTLCQLALVLVTVTPKSDPSSVSSVTGPKGDT